LSASDNHCRSFGFTGTASLFGLRPTATRILPACVIVGPFIPGSASKLQERMLSPPICTDQ